MGFKFPAQTAVWPPRMPGKRLEKQEGPWQHLAATALEKRIRECDGVIAARRVRGGS